MNPAPANVPVASRQQAWLRLGRFGRARGLAGEVWFTADNAETDALRPGLTLYLRAPEPARPLAVRSAFRQKGRFLLTLLGVEDRSAAEALSQQLAFVRRQDLPPLEEGEFYLTDLLGLPVTDAEGTPLGQVADLLTSSAQEVLAVRDAEGRECLVPLVDALVAKVDLDDGIVLACTRAEVEA